jgi:hypothetical protein
MRRMLRKSRSVLILSSKDGYGISSMAHALHIMRCWYFYHQEIGSTSSPIETVQILRNFQTKVRLMISEVKKQGIICFNSTYRYL